MNFAKLTFPQAPAIPSVPLLGGAIKLDGHYREWSLEIPAAGDLFFILRITDYGSYAISIESILRDVFIRIETQEVRTP